jgi:carbamoyltransferase
MYLLGISAFYHDSAACLLKDGKIIAAAQEERFTRKKHDSAFPSEAIKYCLTEAGIDAKELTNVIFYEKPFVKFERLLETYFAFAPRGLRSFCKAIPVWVKDKIFQKSVLAKSLNEALEAAVDWKGKLLFSEHHLSHAASAFYPSPFRNAAVLTLDGVGEWTTASIAIGSNSSLEIIKEIHFPHSIGLLYSAFTYYLGFKVNSGEYKVMGLAPYGRPIYAKLIRDHLVQIADDGSFHLDMRYFEFATGLTMTSKKFDRLFGAPPREPESQLTQRDMDLAASIQSVVEEVVVRLGKSIREITGEKYLCLAGGVALNCVANGVLRREKIFDDIWIQPAAGDSGGALGSALVAWHLLYGSDRSTTADGDGMSGSYLGPEYSNAQIEQQLLACGAKFEKLNDRELIERTAEALIKEKAIGWMQGRMEFGPRALGSRSIIADPRSPRMQKQLNLKVKFRESFRPFAPSVLAEDAGDWFEEGDASPYMLFVSNVKQDKRLEIDAETDLFGIDRLNVTRSLVPAITHVDYSARLQTIHKETNPVFHALVSCFKEKTGCPMVVNTSFNVRGEPIVCEPRDAFRCFMGTDLDVLVVGNYFLRKDEQNSDLFNQYQKKYELD